MRFKRPTIDEIREYCAERRNNVDAEKFFNYYESNGWKVGKNSMKDWKACVRTWERNSKEDTRQEYDSTKNTKLTGSELDELLSLRGT